jgi:predicted acyl esterase
VYLLVEVFGLRIANNKCAMKQIILCAVIVFLMFSVAFAAPEDRGTYDWSQYTVNIPARDGGTITALLYVPNAQHTYPVLTIRHGFNKEK